jgi:predicted Fe-Mo cluster-binding NifX family protein
MQRRKQMKLCIPTSTGTGSEALICDHFGSASVFVLYDQQTGTYESVDNPKADHEHGQCRPMELLEGREIVAMVCKGMGRNAVAAVERSGIKVFTTQGITVGDSIEEFMAGRLIKLGPENSCTGHGCH